MGKKSKIITLVLSCLLLVGALALIFWEKEKPQADTDTEKNEQEVGFQDLGQDVEIDILEEIQIPVIDVIIEEELVKEPEETQKPSNNTSSVTVSKPVVYPKPQSKPKDEVKTISFPYEIPNTTLVVQDVKSYDGIFLEDASDKAITGVSAMILENTGNKCVEYVNVEVKTANQTLIFEGSTIDAGSIVVLQEKNAQKYEEAAYLSCNAATSEVDAFEMSSDKISVTETEAGALKVENISGADIPCVRVFYKFYMEEKNVYVGGITYVAKLVDLKAGTSQEVAPSHYAAGYSKVMMVKTYETAE